jgi:hypothetical protein
MHFDARKAILRFPGGFKSDETFEALTLIQQAGRNACHSALWPRLLENHQLGRTGGCRNHFSRRLDLFH